ncbi:BQ2448_1178 [Microbotryum intermedium]|uniref:BQ2448_1178 protein n=1 Tax=Microbotryum intermedium TaxID=269621 RepID=A0A238FD27_9BASI|nr:BQ2448_1178 [Microbotryum intermedium]
MEAITDFFTKALEAPHDAYVFLDQSDNVLARQIVHLLNTPAVVAFYTKLTSLLSDYSHLIIPFIGLCAQLTMSSYTRRWTLEKAEKREAEARKALSEQREKEQRQAAVGAGAGGNAGGPKVEDSAKSSATSNASQSSKSSSSSPTKTAKGKKGKK